ncbi:MAG: NUDIX domain-containing protein [Thiobacillaceae bacterium]
MNDPVYRYAYPHPAVTADVALFTIRDERLQILLIRRGQEPFAGSWALPGGFVEPGECLEECALRELREETGVIGVYLEQLYTFGNPQRDPRERVISVAYYGLTPVPSIDPKAASDASQAAWFDVDALPTLAFDHADIIAKARERLRAKLGYSTIAFQFMPERFTLTELQTVYETLLGETLDKRNFRKRILALGLVKATGDERRDGKHRPAALYRTSHPDRVDFIK